MLRLNLNAESAVPPFVRTFLCLFLRRTLSCNVACFLMKRPNCASSQSLACFESYIACMSLELWRPLYNGPYDLCPSLVEFLLLHLFLVRSTCPCRYKSFFVVPFCHLALMEPIWARYCGLCPSLFMEFSYSSLMPFTGSTCPCRYNSSSMVPYCHLALLEPLWAKHR